MAQNVVAWIGVRGSVGRVLAEPAQSLTDLALGVVTLTLAVRAGRLPGVHRYWRAAFWWFGLAALAGAVHHGVMVRSEQAADVSWTVISLMVVVAVSYLLAGTVEEVLGPGRRRAFWLLRSVGIVAYAIVALTGNAGIATILACEGITMICILALWGWAARRRHPLARPMVAAIAASGAAAAMKALPRGLLEPVGLDPTSIYHLAQIPGMVLLFTAVAGGRSVGSSRSMKASTRTRRWATLVSGIVALALPAAVPAAEGASFVATLKAPGHHPKAGKRWPITVTAKTKSGKPVRAKASYQFLYQGQVVATRYPFKRSSPYPFKGKYRDRTFVWPARAVGYKLTLRVVVETKKRGTRNLDYWVRVED
jgi:hypothetical protein